MNYIEFYPYREVSKSEFLEFFAEEMIDLLVHDYGMIVNSNWVKLVANGPAGGFIYQPRDKPSGFFKFDLPDMWGGLEYIEIWVTQKDDGWDLKISLADWDVAMSISHFDRLEYVEKFHGTHPYFKAIREVMHWVVRHPFRLTDGTTFEPFRWTKEQHNFYGTMTGRIPSNLRIVRTGRHKFHIYPKAATYCRAFNREPYTSVQHDVPHIAVRDYDVSVWAGNLTLWRKEYEDILYWVEAHSNQFRTIRHHGPTS